MISGTDGTSVSDSSGFDQDFLTLCKSVPIGLCAFDRDLRFVFINEWLAKINGLSIDDHLGRTLSEILPDIAAGVEPQLRGVIETGESVVAGSVEAETSAQIGKRCFEHYYSATKSNDGVVQGVVCIVHDVTERKRAEEKATRFSTLLENSLNEIYIFDPETLQFLEANRGARENLGYSMEELRALTPLDLKPEVTVESFAELIEPLRTGEREIVQFTTVHRRKDGSLYPVEVYLQRMVDGSPVFVAIILDITERKRTEEALRESERRFRTLFEESPIPLWEEDFSLVKKNVDLIREDHAGGFENYIEQHPEKILEYAKMVKVIDVNKAALELHDARSKRELLGGLAKIFSEESIVGFKNELMAIAEEDTQCEFESVIRTLNGQSKHVDLKWAVVPGFEETLERVYLSTIDITERKRAEEALRESEMINRSLLEGSPVCNKIIDLDGNLQYMSSAGIDQLKIPDIQSLYGQAYPSIFYPESIRAPLVEGLRRALEGQTSAMEAPIPDADGNNMWFDTTFVPALDNDGQVKHVIATSVNITERKQAEEEQRQFEQRMQQTQALESLGVMAGGIAHDFNNLLHVIGGNVTYALSEMSTEASSRENLLEIQTAVRRATELTDQMLAYSGERTLVIEKLDLTSLVREMAQLLEVSHSKMAIVKYRFDENLPAIGCDPSQVRQVVMNLITNASEAIGDESGLISIETGVLNAKDEQVSSRDYPYGPVGDRSH